MLRKLEKMPVFDMEFKGRKEKVGKSENAVADEFLFLRIGLRRNPQALLVINLKSMQSLQQSENVFSGRVEARTFDQKSEEI